MSNPKSPSYMWAILIAVSIFALWLLNWFFAQSLEHPGTFGDMFGAVNSLFTGMALAGLVYAILLQRHEVSLLTEELKRTKKIIEAQQTLAEKQEENLKVQLFEGTFFNYFKVLTELVDGLDLRGPAKNNYPVISKGKDVLSSKLRSVEEIVKRKNGRGLYGDPEKGVSEQAYSYVYTKSKADLGHYYRTLYNLVKFVDSSEIEMKRRYINLIRAQLTDDEAMLLFLNGLSPNGSQKFKPLIEEYSLLKNVDQEAAVFKGAKDNYAPSAFGKE